MMIYSGVRQMTEFSGKPVVVGVDGSASGLAAVRFAAEEAVLRDRPLQVVHGFIWPAYHVPKFADLRRDAERIVREAVAAASALAPRSPVSGHVWTASPERSCGWNAARRRWPSWAPVTRPITVPRSTRWWSTWRHGPVARSWSPIRCGRPAARYWSG
jgi:hypothetical protein